MIKRITSEMLEPRGRSRVGPGHEGSGSVPMWFQTVDVKDWVLGGKREESRERETVPLEEEKSHAKSC